MDYARFEQACKKKDTTPTALTLKLGLSKGTATAWKKCGNPSADILFKLAEELDVSTYYLMGVTDDPSPPKKTFTNDDKLNNEISKLTPENKDKAREYIELLKIREEYTQELTEGLDMLGEKTFIRLIKAILGKQ